MKRMLFVVLALIMFTLMATSNASADWEIPINPPTDSGSQMESQRPAYTFRVKVTEDSLATRSGPSTEHTGNGTLANMKNRVVTVLSRSADTGGTGWVEIELEYTSGAYRRAWIGAERLNLTDNQLDSLRFDYEYALGNGTINGKTTPRQGPGLKYIGNKDFTYTRGSKVVVIASENDYYLVESQEWNPNEGKYQILRCWVPTSSVNMD